VITSKTYDESSDIYSYGIMLWEMVARDVPFGDIKVFPTHLRSLNHTQGDTQFAIVSQLIQKVVRKQERPVIPTGCPPQFAQLIRACWHADPKARPSFPSIVKLLESPQFQQMQSGLVPWVNCTYCAESMQ